MKTIANAEAQAEQIVLEAQQKGRSLVEQAAIDAKEKQELTRQRVRDQSRTDAAKAEHKGEELIAKLLQEAQEEISVLKKNAAAKEKAVVETIISQLV